MQYFVPYTKMSKKARREADRLKRGSWGGLNPVTRKPAPLKAYNRAKIHKGENDNGYD